VCQGPHKLTQPQLFGVPAALRGGGVPLAMLALKQLFKIDYRGLAEWLAKWAELREALELKRVPHCSTLCYADGRC